MDKRRSMRGATRLAPLALLATAVLATFLVSVGTAGSAVSARNGKLLFVAPWQGGRNSIWIMNANGSGKQVLTPHVGGAQFILEDSEPNWSPNGTEVAFVRARARTDARGNGTTGAVTEIDVMNANGSGQRRLTHSTTNEWGPAWSPGGKTIAFVRGRSAIDGDKREIYVMKANGSGVTRLTQLVVNACNGDTTLDAREPAWSPDGTKIAFTSKDAAYPCNDEIYVMNADGTGKTHLTGNGANASHAAWSPDGTKITFQSENLDISYNLRTYTFEIYVMNADGSGQTRLTKNDNYCPYGCPNRETHLHPIWSPDGTKIAFTRYIDAKTIDQNPRFDAYVMTADGSGRRVFLRHFADFAWGPVPTGHPNPLPAVKVTLHPSMTLRCLRGSGSPDVIFAGRVAPLPGIRGVSFSINGKEIPYISSPPVYEFGVNVLTLPKAKTWVVKAAVVANVGESEGTLVVTKNHAGHC